MEQMYMVEIFIDKVTVFANTEDTSTGDKNFIVKVKFGPKTQFIIKENQLIAAPKQKPDDTMEMNEWGYRQWSRTIRVGRSLLFPSYPDTLLAMLAKFPLEIEVWTDDVNEPDHQIYVGVGIMVWQTEFFLYLKESANPLKLHNPLTLKEVVTIFHECCCSRAGEVTFILRLSALGDRIFTEFQQNLSDPDRFCFRTDKAPSMFECKRVEGDDLNFCMVGSLYETATLEDPEITGNVHKKIEVCTELESCGVTGLGQKTVCDQRDEPEKKFYRITKIRMGDIVGPCGNTNCLLAQKVKKYLRNLDSYKIKAVGLEKKFADPGTRKICGSCNCKDDRWHREDCPENKPPVQAICGGCSGMAKTDDTCKDRVDKHFGTGATPKSGSPAGSTKGTKTQIQYALTYPDYQDAIFGQNYIVQDYFEASYFKTNIQYETCTSEAETTTDTVGRLTCHKSIVTDTSCISSKCNMGRSDPWVFNAEVPNTSKQQPPTYNNPCTDIPDDKECKCRPPKPSPPCKTFDCVCLEKTLEITSRKMHRPYCPLYKHKLNCPVTMSLDEDEVKKEEEEEEIEPLPYGLPPVQLGPCPVLGRPCSVPDGFARMYRTAVLPTQPPSYSNAGKLCCSKEYQRIKKALKEYMDNKKDHDMRCINKFNIDTERRCCDKEQVLKSLMGKECCGAHKMSIQEKFKLEKPPNPKP